MFSRDFFRSKKYATYMTSASLRKKADVVITKTVQQVRNQPDFRITTP